MKRLTLFVLFFSMSLTGYGAPLTRPQAERIIKSKSQVLFTDKLAFRINATQTVYGHFSDDQLNRRVHTDYTQLPKGKFLEAKLADILEKVGVLKIVSLENRLDPYRNQLAVARYTCVPDPDLEITNSVPLGVENLVVSTEEKVSFYLGHEHYTRITGIVQENNRAVVEVETLMTKTDMYKKLGDCIVLLGKREGDGFSLGNDLTWWNNTMAWFTELNQKLNVTQKYNIPFIKFDDGWRIAL